MKTHYWLIVTFSLTLLAAASCRQDPIFFKIHSETAPQKPRIEGSPTNMVVTERIFSGTPVPILYVASGRLHWYAKAKQGTGESQWDSNEYAIPQPKGKIISLAATKDRLYALCLENPADINATLSYITTNGKEWKKIKIAADVKVTVQQEDGKSKIYDYSLIQSIYADTEADHLFVGARDSNGNNTYAILQLDKAVDTLKMLKSGTSIFSGAVFKDTMYYLCTRGDGIFRVNADNLTIQPLTDSSSMSDADQKRYQTFMGIIKLKDAESTIIAIERNEGSLYKVNSESYERIKHSGSGNSGNWMMAGNYATGALALWEKPGEPTTKMLIIGIQGGLYSSTSTSSYIHGYVEFDLHDNNALDTGSNRHDSKSKNLKSVDNIDRYTANLGKHPINHLLQSPQKIDNDMIFFASTQTAGLWSYRDRGNNGAEWNAEE